MKNIFIHFTIMTGKYAIFIFIIIVAAFSFVLEKNSYGRSMDAKKRATIIQPDNQSITHLFKNIEKDKNLRFFHNKNTSNILPLLNLKAHDLPPLHLLAYFTDETGLKVRKTTIYLPVQPRVFFKIPHPPTIKNVSSSFDFYLDAIFF